MPTRVSAIPNSGHSQTNSSQRPAGRQRPCPPPRELGIAAVERSQDRPSASLGPHVRLCNGVALGYPCLCIRPPPGAAKPGVIQTKGMRFLRQGAEDGQAVRTLRWTGGQMARGRVMKARSTRAGALAAFGQPDRDVGGFPRWPRHRCTGPRAKRPAPPRSGSRCRSAAPTCPCRDHHHAGPDRQA